MLTLLQPPGSKNCGLQSKEAQANTSQQSLCQIQHCWQAPATALVHLQNTTGPRCDCVQHLSGRFHTLRSEMQAA